jgi:hypothetical protein
MTATTLRLLRFTDLKAAGIVQNWTQLKVMVEKHGFPAGFHLSPQVRAWHCDDVEAWIEAKRGQSAKAA